jgi:hypothetical protein
MIPTVQRSIALLLVCGLALCQAAAAQQRAVHDGLPSHLDSKARYVIYLHGRIIEDQGRRPKHPAWGVYEYQQILEALATDGVLVISEQRPPMTDMDRFAGHVADQVRQLLGAGVRAEQISVVGFSKGGGIAMRASALLENARINFVFLAACGDGDFSGVDIKVWGRILSVYEASDDDGRSCASLFAKSGSTGTRSEIRVNIGQQHGAFFRPHAEWLSPVLRWVQQAP